jgi:hypothetical protein
MAKYCRKLSATLELDGDRPCSFSWREGSESDRVSPDLDQRLGSAAKPIAKR